MQLCWENEAATTYLQMLAEKNAFGISSRWKRGKRYGAGADSSWTWKINKFASKAVFVAFICACIVLLVKIQCSASLQMDIAYLGNCLQTSAFVPKCTGQVHW